MKTKILLTLGLLAAALSAAAAGVALTPSPASRVRLDGDSSLHPWFAETSSFTAVLTIDADAATPGAVAAAAAAGKPATMIVTIPVASLKSEHSGLDKNLRKALSADKYPDIVYTLERYEGKEARLGVHGKLTVAGSSQPAVLLATATVSGNFYVVDGEQTLLMTDYGVKPPVMMMGAIKTANKIIVKYHLEFEPAKRK
jgi:polyisoprenoid-binding protein YceI